MSKFSAPAEKLNADIRAYIDAQADGLKLRATKGLSKGLSSLTSILLLFIIGSACILVLSFALVLLVGELMGSYSTAAFIIAGALFLVALIVFLLRNVLFKNTFVGQFIDIFFPEEPQTDKITKL